MTLTSARIDALIACVDNFTYSGFINAMIEIRDSHEELRAELAALKQENAELRAALRKPLTLAEEGVAHPEGADYYLRRIASELRAAIDGAREGQKSANDAQGGAK